MDADRAALKRKRSRVRYVLLGAGVLAVGLAGYAGFLAYPRLDLPSELGLGLLMLAAATGFAAFFSPCSFPLLLTLLARETTDPARHAPAVVGAMRFALAMSVGALAFLLGFGLLVSAGGGAIAEQVTFDSPLGRALRLTIGLLLIWLGLAQLGVLRVGFSRVAALAAPLERMRGDLGKRHRFGANAVYGFAYLLAGFG